MLIYEKNNKLNINFDNEISENPDIQIGKDGDKTEVLVDGSSNPAIPVPVLPEDVGKTIVVNEDGSYALANAGGGSVPFVVLFSGGFGNPSCNKTFSEIENALSQKLLILGCIDGSASTPTQNALSTSISPIVGSSGVSGYQVTFFDATSSRLRTISYTVATDNSVTALVKALNFA